MAIIENIIDKYYFYSTEILQCFLGIFTIFSIGGFILEEGYRFREDALHSVHNLIEALTALKKFYISRENDYESNYSNLLWWLLYQVVLQYEQYSAWFGDKKEEIDNRIPKKRPPHFCDSLF